MMKSAALVLALLPFGMAFPEDCTNTSVVDDVANGWTQAGCEGMEKQPDISTALACKKACTTNVKCTTWHWQKPKNAEKETCFIGKLVKGCADDSTDENIELKEGQRIQHGAIKVVKDLTLAPATWYKGLLKFENFKQDATDTDKAVRCQKQCYIDVTCTVYQYSSAKGCFVESLPDNKKGEVAEEGFAAYETYMAGQLIEHFCPVYVAPAAAPTTPEEGFPWLYAVLGGVGGLAAVGGGMFALQKKVKKSRVPEKVVGSDCPVENWNEDYDDEDYEEEEEELL
jgi:hypothetical protein